MASVLSGSDRPRNGRGHTRHRNGSTPVYSEELAEVICDRLATGESLYAICKTPGMPGEKTVRGWAETRPNFATKYTRAREFGYDSIAEQVMAISDQEFTGPDGFVDNGKVQAARLQTDSRRWFLSKLMPKRYGDKVTQEITGDGDNPLITRIELVPIDVKPKVIEHDDMATTSPRHGKRKAQKS